MRIVMMAEILIIIILYDSENYERSAQNLPVKSASKYDRIIIYTDKMMSRNQHEELKAFDGKISEFHR